jgi:hypothetical protein
MSRHALVSLSACERNITSTFTPTFRIGIPGYGRLMSRTPLLCLLHTCDFEVVCVDWAKLSCVLSGDIKTLPSLAVLGRTAALVAHLGAGAVLEEDTRQLSWGDSRISSKERPGTEATTTIPRFISLNTPSASAREVTSSTTTTYYVIDHSYLLRHRPLPPNSTSSTMTDYYVKHCCGLCKGAFADKTTRHIASYTHTHTHTIWGILIALQIHTRRSTRLHWRKYSALIHPDNAKKQGPRVIKEPTL